jgi:hypothetical protein
MDAIKIPIQQLIKEPSVNNARYSHPAWTKKVSKGIMLCDFDKAEKLIEVEIEDTKYWIGIITFFGKVIAETKAILLVNESGYTTNLTIVAVEEIKIKRTNYWKLIFEVDLPF